MNKYQAIGAGSLIAATATAGTVYNYLPTNEQEISEEKSLVSAPNAEQESPANIPNIEQPPKEESISEEQESNPNINLDKQEEELDTELLENLSEESIGLKYKNYLIGSKSSNEPWKRKMDIWKENIKNNKTNKPFEWKSKGDPDYEKLKTRCSNAYRKNKWEFGKDVKDKFAREKYWAMVWTMCGKEKINVPSGWGDY